MFLWHQPCTFLSLSNASARSCTLTNPTQSEDWVAFLSYCNSQQAMGLPWIFFEKQLPLTSLTYPFSISSLQVSKRGPSVKYYDPQWHLLLVGCSLIGDLQNAQQKEPSVWLGVVVGHEPTQIIQQLPGLRLGQNSKLSRIWSHVLYMYYFTLESWTISIHIHQHHQSTKNIKEPRHRAPLLGARPLAVSKLMIRPRLRSTVSCSNNLPVF